MLPQRQRAGRGRVALLLGCSVAGFLLLVLLAHPSLLPWNASPAAGLAASLEAAVAAPPLAPLAEGEELHLDMDMVQQQRLIESIHRASPCWTLPTRPRVSPPVAACGAARRLGLRARRRKHLNIQHRLLWRLQDVIMGVLLSC